MKVTGAFKTIFSRMGSVAAGKFIDEDLSEELGDFNTFVNDTEKALSKVGISLRDTNQSFRSAKDVINEVATSWSKYNNVEKAGIATSLAGTRQRENLIALFDNYTKAMDLATESTNANGTAMQKYAVYQESIAATQARITTLWETFLTKIDLEGIIKDLLAVLEVVMKITSSDIISGLVKYGTIPAIASVSFVTLARSIYQTVGPVKNLAAVMALLEGGTKDFTKAFKASPIMGFALVASLIIGVAVAFDALTISTKEAKEAFQNTLGSIESMTSEISNLEQKLKDAKDRMAELRGSGDISVSISARSEFDELQKTTAELERELSIQKSLLSMEQDRAKAQAEAMYRPSGWDNIGEKFEREIELLRQTNREVENVKDAYANGEISAVAYNSRMDKLNESLARLNPTLTETVSDVKNVADNIEDDAIRDSLYALIDAFNMLYATTEEKFSSVWDDTQFDDVKKELAEVEIVTEDNINAYPKLASAFKAAGFSAKEAADYINGLNTAQEGLQVSAGKLETYGSIIEKVSEKTKILAQAQFELEKTGVISIETYEKLSKEFEDVDRMVRLTSKGFVVANGSLSDLLGTSRSYYEEALKNAGRAAEAIIKAKAGEAGASALNTEQMIIELRTLIRLNNEKLREKRAMKEDVSEESDSASELRKALDDLTTAQANITRFDEIVGQIYKSSYRAASDASKSASTASKDVETAYEAFSRITEHQIYLSQQLGSIYKEDVTRQKEYLAEVSRQSDLYVKLQEGTVAEANRLRKEGKDNASEDIQELSKKWWGYENERVSLNKDATKSIADREKELADKQKEYTDERVEALKNSVEALLNEREKYYEKVEAYYDFEIDKLNSVISLTENYHDIMGSIKTEMRSINSELEISKKSYKYMDEELRKTLFNQADYDILSDKLNQIADDSKSIYDAYLSELEGLTTDEYYKVEDITNEFERQYELKKMEYDIAKNELSLVKKQTELQNVLADRNVRMFLNGKWVWTADHEKVKSAMEGVASAEEDLANAKEDMVHEKVIQQYESMQDLLNEHKDAANREWEEMKATWETIQKSLEDPTENIASILNEMATSNIPELQNIVSAVGATLSKLAYAASPATQMNFGTGATDYSNATGGMSYQEYLQNKVDWQRAYESGDVAEMERLNKKNIAYRGQSGSLDDNITSDMAADILAKYFGVSNGGVSGSNRSASGDSGGSALSNGIYSAMQGIANTTANLVGSLVSAVTNKSSSRDSHDVYFNGSHSGMLTGSDSSTISSILRRYVPVNT